MLDVGRPDSDVDVSIQKRKRLVLSRLRLLLRHMKKGKDSAIFLALTHFILLQSKLLLRNPSQSTLSASHQDLLEVPAPDPYCASAEVRQPLEVLDLRETIDWHYRVLAHSVRLGHPFAAEVAEHGLVVGSGKPQPESSSSFQARPQPLRNESQRFLNKMAHPMRRARCVDSGARVLLPLRFALMGQMLAFYPRDPVHQGLRSKIGAGKGLWPCTVSFARTLEHEEIQYGTESPHSGFQGNEGSGSVDRRSPGL